MRPTFQSILVVGVLAIVDLSLGDPTAQAQAVGGGSYRGANPNYYYSPGGYSGGYYFRPGYYANPGYTPSRVTVTASSVSPARTSSGTGGRTRSGATNYHDWTTGRENLAIPLARPWLKPLR